MGLRDALRESSEIGAILATPPGQRPVLFYAEDSHTYIQFEGLVRELVQRRIPVTYVTSQPDDPIFGRSDELLTVRFLSRQLANLMKRIEGSLIVMTMPDLGRFHVPKPENARVLYLFHSLNSLHTSYRDGAFDHYDHFACTGPHHIKELERLAEIRQKPVAQFHEVGYYKLDRIERHHSTFSPPGSARPRVLLAPSWSPGNLLEAHGRQIVHGLLAAKMSVIVRPHPQFFHSLYPTGREVVDQLVQEFQSSPDVEFELTIDSEDSFHTADLMVSDWSGAAYEYALGTRRPVMFVDTPQKLFNPEWAEVGLPAFEEAKRHEVGIILSSAEIEAVGDRSRQLIEGRESWSEKLSDLRKQLVFNPGSSSAVLGDLVESLIQRRV